jgi:hypothetical protein
MKLDVYEVSYERRVANDTREVVSLGIPFNSEITSTTVDLSALTATAIASYIFTVTVPGVSRKTLTSGTFTVFLEAKTSSTEALDISSSSSSEAESTWTSIVQRTVTGTANDDTPGFQFTHNNTVGTLDNWRLRITASGGTINLVDISVLMDVIYGGNQRRKIENIIGTLISRY